MKSAAKNGGSEKWRCRGTETLEKVNKEDRPNGCAEALQYRFTGFRVKEAYRLENKYDWRYKRVEKLRYKRIEVRINGIKIAKTCDFLE